MNKVQMTAILCLLLHSAGARADQCAALNAAQAKKAESAIRPGMTVVKFCEPCGDKALGEPFVVKTVGKTGKGQDISLVVNGEPEDLAYLFVQQPDKSFANAAALAGCPTEGVSPSIQVGGAASGGSGADDAKPAEARVTISVSTEQIKNREKAIAQLLSACTETNGGPVAASVGCDTMVLLAEDLMLFRGQNPPKTSAKDALIGEIQRVAFASGKTEEMKKFKRGIEAFQCRSRQSEAKLNLKAIYVSEESYRAENGTYLKDLNKIGFKTFGMKQRYKYAVLSASKDKFAARATGEAELAGDVWEVNEAGEVKNLKNACDSK
jgi:hypothetical protein